MNANIKKLIDHLMWPGINAITFNDGKMTLLDIEFFEGSRYYIGPIADTSIESYLKYNEDMLSSFDIAAKTEHGDYEVSVGDGSDESNGVILVRRKTSGHLLWFAFFENSDPFKSVYVEEGIVAATTSGGVRWEISIENPLDIHLIY